MPDTAALRTPPSFTGRFPGDLLWRFRRDLLTSEGDFHHQQRKLVLPAFHHAFLRAYAGVMTARAVWMRVFARG